MEPGVKRVKPQALRCTWYTSFNSFCFNADFVGPNGRGESVVSHSLRYRWGNSVRIDSYLHALQDLQIFISEFEFRLFVFRPAFIGMWSQTDL